MGDNVDITASDTPAISGGWPKVKQVRLPLPQS